MCECTRNVQYLLIVNFVTKSDARSSLTYLTIKKGTFYNITKTNLSYRSLVQKPTFSTTTKALQMADYSPVTKSALLKMMTSIKPWRVFKYLKKLTGASKKTKR